jgi:hypothetical protein
MVNQWLRHRGMNMITRRSFLKRMLVTMTAATASGLLIPDRTLALVKEELEIPSGTFTIEARDLLVAPDPFRPRLVEDWHARLLRMELMLRERYEPSLARKHVRLDLPPKEAQSFRKWADEELGRIWPTWDRGKSEHPDPRFIACYRSFEVYENAGSSVITTTVATNHVAPVRNLGDLSTFSWASGGLPDDLL